ncbi:hypothetical protein C4375_03740 [Devosia sp. I507]|nr:hypothetical protein C4375_03740 [Devosia sp. I507]
MTGNGAGQSTPSGRLQGRNGVPKRLAVPVMVDTELFGHIDRVARCLTARVDQDRSDIFKPHSILAKRANFHIESPHVMRQRPDTGCAGTFGRRAFAEILIGDQR